MTRRRVLHIITGLGTGGAEGSLLRILAHTPDATAHAVLSLTSLGTRAADLTALGVSVQALGLSRGAIAPHAAFAIRRYLREWAPHVVHGWMYHGNLAATVASWLSVAPCPVIWSVRHALDAWSEEPPRLRGLIRASALLSGAPRAVVYNSFRSARQHALRGYNAARATVIPNGVCTSRFHRDEMASRALREAEGIPQDAVVFGLIARVHPLKDHSTFLAAAARLASTNPRAWFLLSGTGTAPGEMSPDGNLDLIVAHATRESPQLAARLVRLGERRDVATVLGACDVVSVTSKSEGSPNAAAEAMACGVPCVVTDVGDAADLVGDSGRVVVPGDVDALVAAWTTLGENASLRCALGEAARTRIITRYSASTEAAAFARVWEHALVGAAPATRAA